MLALYIDGAYIKIVTLREIAEISEWFQIRCIDIEAREVHL